MLQPHPALRVRPQQEERNSPSNIMARSREIAYFIGLPKNLAEEPSHAQGIFHMHSRLLQLHAATLIDQLLDYLNGLLLLLSHAEAAHGLHSQGTCTAPHRSFSGQFSCARPPGATDAGQNRQ